MNLPDGDLSIGSAVLPVVRPSASSWAGAECLRSDLAICGAIRLIREIVHNLWPSSPAGWFRQRSTAAPWSKQFQRLARNNPTRPTAKKNDVFTATSSPFASQLRILSGETRSIRATSVTVNPRSGLLSNPANDQGIWLDFRFDGA